MGRACGEEGEVRGCKSVREVALPLKGFRCGNVQQ